MAELLKKTPAQISIVDLLITSEHHREQMIEVLQKAHVKDYINPERLADLVGQIMAPRVIYYFSYEYIPADRTTHTHPLSSPAARARSPSPNSHYSVDDGSLRC